MPISEYVTGKLNNLCKEHNITKYRLAQITGLSQTTVANMLNGSTMPTLASLDLVCDAFGISIAQFFTDDGTEMAGLSDKQRNLLNSWANLPPEKREMVEKFIQSIQ